MTDNIQIYTAPHSSNVNCFCCTNEAELTVFAKDKYDLMPSKILSLCKACAADLAGKIEMKVTEDVV